MVVVPAPASANDPGATFPRGAPLALTLSGGGTKGAYMAGHLYYMDLVARGANTMLEPRVFTGASAGSINAMIAALSSCVPAQPDPTQSLYWTTWTEVGLRQVFDPTRTRATGLLTTKAFDPAIARMRAIWDAGLPAGCDVLFGAAVTRVTPRMVVLAPGFPPLPRSRETVLLRITGRGPGLPPRVKNVVDPTRPLGDLRLPVDGADAKPFEMVVRLILASSAFPVGFAPVNIPHCLDEPDPDGPPTTCTPEQSEPALFLDGGIFDNQPLGLATRAMRYVQRNASGGLVITDHPAFSALPEARYFFLDPRAVTYPAAPPEHAVADPEDVIDIITALFGMIDSASSSALVSVLDEAPAVGDHLLLSRTYFQQVSGTFNGLLERQFREFDFYLGMYSAARTVREHSLGAGLDDVAAALAPHADPAMTAAWRPFHCLRAMLDGVGDLASCDGPALQDFRILLQLVLDQLVDNCRRLPPEVLTGHPQCDAAIAGLPWPAVSGVRTLTDGERRRSADESVVAYQLRLLGRYGFHFRDMGLDREASEDAPERVIEIAHTLVQRLADKQPVASWAIGVLGRIGVDLAMGYLPPEHSIHATLGLGGEFGYSVTFEDPGWRWLRFGVALGLDGLSTVFNGIDDYFALIPKAGVEFEPYGTASIQLRLGLRAGYQFSTGDAFLTGTCDPGNERRIPCSRLITEGYVSASLLGLIRLQLAVTYEPPLRRGQTGRIAVRPTVGIQLNSPF